jgi:hypothetical protein
MKKEKCSMEETKRGNEIESIYGKKASDIVKSIV